MQKRNRENDLSPAQLNSMLETLAAVVETTAKTPEEAAAMLRNAEMH
jgi:hypothetical protein